MFKPQDNGTENCNLQNVIYRGICLLCEEEETERLTELGELHPEIKDVEDHRVVT